LKYFLAYEIITFAMKRAVVRKLFAKQYAHLGSKEAKLKAKRVESELYKCSASLYDDTVYEYIYYMSSKQDMGEKVIDERIRKGVDLWHIPVFKKQCEKQAKINEMITGTIEVVDGALTCPRCRGEKVASYEVQTRSADEPMTVFARCMNKSCDYRWKE
jgi:DNA-directed RNA polymerase subunit M/transcription elongation factor TFIIS